MSEYSSSDLMAAILSLRDATAHRFTLVDARFEAVDRRFEEMRADMNRRFDRVDAQFDDLKRLIVEERPKRRRPPKDRE